MLFINGMPLVVIELKNPGDEDADIWAAWNQLRAYQQDIPDLQVMSDGIQARMGSLTRDRERYLAWRTIDGVTIDPLGPMKELQTLVLGLLQRDFLLEYLRHKTTRPQRFRPTKSTSSPSGFSITTTCGLAG